MSDDTPTQRFPEQSGATPTERIATGEVYEELGEERQKSRTLLVGLIIAGALLLIAIIVLLVLFLGRGSGATEADPTPGATDSGSSAPTDTPLPSDTPAATPTPEPTETQAPPPPPPSNTLAIDSFKTGTKTVFCNTQAPNPTNQYLTFSWKTSNADSIKLGTYDPYGDYQDMYVNLPPDGNTQDMGLQITYFCPEESQKWRLTASANGSSVKQEIKIVNTGDTQ